MIPLFSLKLDQFGPIPVQLYLCMYHIDLRVNMLSINPIVYLYASLEANLSQASISRTPASTRRQKGTDDANTLADCRGDTMRLLGCNGAKPFEIYAIRLDKIGKLAP